MKLNKRLLWPIILIVILFLCWMNSSSISTVLLAIKGTITDGNIIKFSGTAGIGEDAGIASTGVSDAVAKKHSQNTDTGTSQPEFYVDTGGDNVAVKAHIQSTSDPHSVTKTQVGLGNVENLKVKLDATSAPTADDDVDLGYVVGSEWYDVTADKGYVCLDNTDGAAVWTEITSLGTTTFTGLTDTPANYTGEEGKYVKVNVGGDALEFGTVAGESNTASNIGAEIEIFKQKTGVDLQFRTLKADSNKITVTYIPAGGDPGWISPTGHNDPETFWSDEIKAYNKNINDYASSSLTSPSTWGEFIELTKASFGCDKIRFWGYAIPGTNEVDIDVYYDGDWHDVYQGTYAHLQWVEKSLGAIYQVEKARFKLYNGHTESLMLRLYEVEFYEKVADLNYIRLDVNEENIKLDDLGAPDDNTDNDASTTAHGLMPKLPFSGDLLSTTTVAFNADADTTLYTVPTGKRCVLSHAIVVAAGDAGANTTVSIGQNTAETDFVPANTMSNLDAEYDSVILMPIPNTTPLKIKSYAADTVIEAQVASQSGVAGNTIYLFGILY